MGNRYYLIGMKCAYCNAEQEEVYYAPSCGFIVHKCEKCNRVNKINFDENRLEKMIGTMSGIWHNCKKCGCYCELNGYLECSECGKEKY